MGFNVTPEQIRKRKKHKELMERFWNSEVKFVATFRSKALKSPTEEWKAEGKEEKNETNETRPK